MPKHQNIYSAQTTQALLLFGQHIHYARKKYKMTIADLAERIGVSRNTIQSLEKGEGTVAIGSYFEAASILGIDLFQSMQTPLADQHNALSNKIALLPKYVRTKKTEVKDDF